MLRLNRKTEYALLAIRYLSTLPPGNRASVRFVAEHYQIPEMLLGKVMQQLKAGALVVAHKGARGGYALARSTEHISFTEILSLFEESAALVDCLTPNQDAHCPQGECCDIQAPLAVLNGALMRHLEGLSLATFYASVHRTATKDLSLGRLH